MSRKDDFIHFFIENGYSSIGETGFTWRELGEKFGYTAEAARGTWNKFKRKKGLFGANFEQFCKERNINPAMASSVQYVGKKDYFNIHLKKPESGITRKDIAEVVESIQVPVIPSKPPVVLPSAVGQLIVNNTDQHVGMDNEGGIYGGTWSKEEYLSRMRFFAQDVMERGKDYKHIHVNFLGDMGDGMDGTQTRGRFKNQLPQNLNDKQIFRVALESLLHLVEVWSASELPSITMHLVTNSNHGGFLDFAVAETLKRIVEEGHNEKIMIDVIEGFCGSYTAGDFDILVTHGFDEKNMKKPMPYDLSPDWVAKVRFMMENYNCRDRKTILIRGDLHQSKWRDKDYFIDHIVPAFSQPSRYVQSNYHSKYSGGYTFIGVGNGQKTFLQHDFPQF